MEILDQLLTLQNVILCIIIWILVLIQRKIVEFFWKKAKESKVWNELLLPLGPLGTGALIGVFIKSYPYPEMFNEFWPRIFFCIVCGLASAHVYKMAKKWISTKSLNNLENK